MDHTREQKKSIIILMKPVISPPTIGIAILAIVAIYFIFFKHTRYSQINYVVLEDKKIEVEIADTQAERTKGLMFRKELAENSGMLFVFDNSSRHTFWMANTYIPLDIIWINEDMEIVYISKDTPPCTETGNLQAMCTTYSPDKAAKFVLEVNAGWTEKNGIKVGDAVNFIK
uniref:DUF192 domain-containing protein n=1 Tax=candidate division WWE3 bacterium TaxID=2053526 RepID=A0A7C4XUW9_UNCKA